jgi:probable phosphoglycerate mutase
MYNVPWCDNTAITIVDYENGKFDLVIEGDASHLTSELGTVQNQDWWEDYIKERGHTEKAEVRGQKSEVRFGRASQK